MATTLPPDPYRVLGLSSTATAAEIKLAYRKAALRCHPDKAKDNGDEFVRIQQAWELIGKEEERSKYDDLVRLETLRAQRPNPQRPFEPRTFSAPASTPLYTARTYQDRTPRYPSYDEPHRYDAFDKEEPNRASSRKYAEYERRSSVKSPRDEAPPPPRRENSTSKTQARERAADKKQREKDKQRDRGQKYTWRASGYLSPEDDGSPPRPVRAASSTNARDYTQRSSEPVRPAPPRRNSIVYDPKYDNLEEEARQHMARGGRSESSSFEKQAPPSSYRAVPRDFNADSTKTARGQRPTLQRRTSTHSTTASSRDRDAFSDASRSHSATNLSTSTRERRSSRAFDPRSALPKIFTNHSTSSPVDARRSRKEDDYHDQPRPAPHRAQTMPYEATTRSSSRRYSATPNTPSGLRYNETPTSATGHSNTYAYAYPPTYTERNDSARDSGYSTSSPSETPVPSEVTDASNTAFKSRPYSSRGPSTPAESFPAFDNYPSSNDHYPPHASHNYPTTPSPVDFSNGRPTVLRQRGTSHSPSSYHDGSYRSTPPPPPPPQQGPSSPQRPRRSRCHSYVHNETAPPPPPPASYTPSTAPPGPPRRQSSSKRSTSYNYSSPYAATTQASYAYAPPPLDRSSTAPPRASYPFSEDNRRTASPTDMPSANSSFERGDRDGDYRQRARVSSRANYASTPPPQPVHHSYDMRDRGYDVRERERDRMYPAPRRGLSRAQTFSPGDR